MGLGLSVAVPPPVFVRPTVDPAPQREEIVDENIPVAASVMPSKAEPAQKQEVQNTVSSFPFSFSPSDFKLPTAEELMKRRHALTAEVEAVVEHDDNNYGVSYPLPEAPKMQEQEQEEEQEQRSDEQQTPCPPAEVSAEVKHTENIFFPKKRNIYIPPAAVAPKMSGLGGLADYGSDSDDGDNDDNDDDKNAPSVAAAAPRFIPLAFPIELSTYDTHASSSVQIGASSGGSEVTEGRPALPYSAASSSASDDMGAFFDSIAHTEVASLVPPDRAIEYQSTTRNHTQTQTQTQTAFPDRPPPKPLLKTIKADSALTAFRPNALRVKRPALQTGKLSAKMPRVDGDSGMQIQGPSSSSSSSSAPSGAEGRVPVPAMSGGVEDAYLNFLDEIGELTG